jgi:hypothetical protein
VPEKRRRCAEVGATSGGPEAWRCSEEQAGEDDTAIPRSAHPEVQPTNVVALNNLAFAPHCHDAAAGALPLARRAGLAPRSGTPSIHWLDEHPLGTMTRLPTCLARPYSSSRVSRDSAARHYRLSRERRLTATLNSRGA